MKDNRVTWKETFYILLMVFVFLIISFILLLTFNKSKEYKGSIESQIYSSKVEIPGYDLNKPFDLDTYEYNVEVDMDKIQVVCNSIEEISGCNIEIDMKDKDSYDHTLEINVGGDLKKYVIHILKNKDKNNDPINITSIEGIPLNWTNKDVKVIVNAESKLGSNIYYSFDNGKTWTDKNEYEVKENTILSIIVKDNNNNSTKTKDIAINKIDKDKPTLELITQSKSKDKIVIKAIVSDKTSSAKLFSFNNGPYSIADQFEVKKAGIYKITAKDEAGNISEESTIKIEDKDFVEEKKQNEYKVKLNSNGATINSATLTCKSYSKKCKIALPKISRSEGVVIGWSKNKDSKSADYKSGEIIEIENDITLYAITKRTLKATFYKNGATEIGKNYSACEIYNEQKNCNITVPTISRSGGAVLGWNENSEAKESSIRPKQEISISDNVNLYAITYKTLKATFNKNTADSISDTSKKCKLYNKETSCNVLTPTITKKDWTGIGWSTIPTSKSVDIKPNTKININKDITYYAVTAKTITIKFEKNGSTIGKTSQTCKLFNDGEKCEITMPTITRSGWNILGWSTGSTAKSASLKVGAKQTVTKDTTYYAITSKKVTIEFDKNGADSIGTTSSSCNMYNKQENCSITAPTITRSGWNVLGWSWVDTDQGDYITKVNEPIKRNTDGHYYAITYKTLNLSIKDNNETIKTLACNIFNNNRKKCSINVSNLFTRLNDITYIFNKQYIIKGFSNTKGGEIVYKPDTNITISLDSNKTIYMSSFYMSNIVKLNKRTIYLQKGIQDNAYKRIITIENLAPFLFEIPGNVFVFDRAGYNSRWESGLGETYGVTYGGVPRNIDLISSESGITLNGDGYDAWMHELGHAWDIYYASKFGKRVSEQEDFKELHDYYLSKTKESKPQTANEFFAAMTPTYVYFKNNIDGSKYEFKYYYWKQFSTLEDTSMKNYLVCLFDKYINKLDGKTYKTCTFPK